ncbi:MAG: AI-2E family transporter, partial [Actinomycetota bacterium]|nr:AI-2E family transporter [Actinomycetota bacterium]
MSLDPQADASVHPLVRKTAAWSWRLLVIMAALIAFFWVVGHVEVIVVPVLLATMVTAMLLPLVDYLDRRGLPRGAAVAVVILTSIVVVGGILTFVVSQFIQGAPALVEQVTLSITNARNSFNSGMLAHFSNDQIKSATDTAVEALKNNQAKLTSGALSTAGTITEIITGALLMLFTLIFLLQGGRNIFAFVTKIFPTTVRERVRDAGRAGFHSLIGYVRATFLVALVDAVGIGTGLAIMGIPLALPLASLVFLGAFIPLVGAVLTGGLAVIVALIAKGWVYALIAFGLIIAVQQLEAHVLQPLVMGRAVSLHPLAVVLAIAGGGVS